MSVSCQFLLLFRVLTLGYSPWIWDPLALYRPGEEDDMVDILCLHDRSPCMYLYLENS